MRSESPDGSSARPTGEPPSAVDRSDRNSFSARRELPFGASVLAVVLSGLVVLSGAAGRLDAGKALRRIAFDVSQYAPSWAAAAAAMALLGFRGRGRHRGGTAAVRRRRLG